MGTSPGRSGRPAACSFSHWCEDAADLLVSTEVVDIDVMTRQWQMQAYCAGVEVVDRACFALDLARRGEKVAVVSGGDASIFSMAAAVFEAAQDKQFADVPVRVLPAVSAVQAVAARAGAPIGADFAVMSLSDRLQTWAVIEKRLRAVAGADLVLAIYNPASRTRPYQIEVARKVLLEHRRGDT